MTPPQCAAWYQLMCSEADGICICQNLADDTCDLDGIEKFHDVLGRSSLPATVRDAIALASRIVAEQQLTLRGGDVVDPRFSTVMRFERPQDLKHRIHKEFDGFLFRFAIREADLARTGQPNAAISIDDFEFMLTSVPEFEFGNPMGVIWVTGAVEIEHLSAEEALDRLGLPTYLDAYRNGDVLIRYSYERADLELKVPRALDAVNHALYLPQPCEAGCGATKAISHSAGVAEAVHRRATLHKPRLTFKVVQR